MPKYLNKDDFPGIDLETGGTISTQQPSIRASFRTICLLDTFRKLLESFRRWKYSDSEEAPIERPSPQHCKECIDVEGQLPEKKFGVSTRQTMDNANDSGLSLRLNTWSNTLESRKVKIVGIAVDVSLTVMDESLE